MAFLKLPALIGTALALALVAAPTALARKDPLPEVTEDGLHLVPDSKMAIVYVEPGADLEPYRRVKLLDAYVAFKKNWERDHRSAGTLLRVSPSDMNRIKDRMSAEFRDVFTRVLEEGGYPVVEESGADVLLVRPAIVDLNPNAPDIPQAGMSRSYVTSAGDMTLYVELYDSQTGDLLAKALDRKADNRHSDYYTWANSASNKAAAQRILKGWATILLEALNEARQ
ncbi:MAG: DUF3313 family protein [Xanthomonadales bacterium]